MVSSREDKFKCPHCRTMIDVADGMSGKSAACPVCDGSITFPKKKTEQTSSFTCEKCKAVLTVKSDMSGRKVKCPKCGFVQLFSPKQAKVVSNDQGGELSLQDVDEGTFSVRSVEKRAYLAWREHEESKRDSYYKAVAKGIFYPVNALGVVILFTVGIPVVLSILDVATDMIIRNFGGKTIVAGYDAAVFASIFVKVVGVAAVCSVLSSFLFAIVKVTAAGSGAVPVVKGSLHKENLASFSAWGFIYIFPGIFAGFFNSAGENWKLTGLSIILFAVLLPLCPVSFIMTSSRGGNWPFKIGLILKTIEKNSGDYLYLLLMTAVSFLIFILLGNVVSTKAEALLLSEEIIPRLSGFFLKIVSGCLYVFPLVSFARMSGFFARYQKGRLPFKIAESFYGRSSVITKLVLFTGLFALFVPLYRNAANVAATAKVARGCKENLEKVSKLSRDNNSYNLPASEDEFLSRFSNYAVCPFCKGKPGHKKFSYEIRKIPSDAHPFFLTIYDREGNHPDNSRCLLFNNGIVMQATEDEYLKIMEYQKKLEENPMDSSSFEKLKRMIIFHQ